MHSFTLPVYDIIYCTKILTKVPIYYASYDVLIGGLTNIITSPLTNSISMLRFEVCADKIAITMVKESKNKHKQNKN